MIRGADGLDVIQGGKGSDVLTGGKDDDDFVFLATDLGGTDAIRDFKPGDDQLLLGAGVTIQQAFGIDANSDGVDDGTRLVLTNGTTTSVVLLDGVTGIDGTNTALLTAANDLL